jgi:hypothetical protein
MTEEQQKATNELLETLTLGNTVQAEVLRPRIYINTFPKSGTHLANLICAHLAHIQEPRHWLGSFNGNSWKSEWVAKDYLLRVILCMFFVYRDLRDVAVSQTYHIEHPDDDKCRHPNKALYKEMASHEDRLLAVINGVSEFPGIIERWKLYAPWLDVPWVLPVRYEDMRQRPEWVAEKAVNYVIERTTKAYDVRSVFFAETILNAINKAIDNLGTTKYSASYRKGNVGDWQTEFTPKIKKAFKKADQDNWLERLGYTDETEW